MLARGEYQTSLRQWIEQGELKKKQPTRRWKMERRWREQQKIDVEVGKRESEKR